MLKKGRCTLCIWWSVCSLAVVSHFVYVLFFVLFCCYYCYLLIFWLRNNGPLFQAYPSTILSMNWHTPKHLGLLLCTGPPSSYFISSVPMLVLFTLCTIFLKLVITALRANLMLLQQLWFSVAVVHQQPELCSCRTLLCFITFLFN